MEQGSAITFFDALHTKGLRELFIITRSFKPTPVRGLPEVNRTCRHFMFLAPLRCFVKVLDGALSTDFLEPLDGLDVLAVPYDMLSVVPQSNGHTLQDIRWKDTPPFHAYVASQARRWWNPCGKC